jgi:hypothetical protein
VREKEDGGTDAEDEAADGRAEQTEDEPLLDRSSTTETGDEDGSDGCGDSTPCTRMIEM